jgi:hypothetical protein
MKKVRRRLYLPPNPKFTIQGYLIWIGKEECVPSVSSPRAFTKSDSFVFYFCKPPSPFNAVFAIFSVLDPIPILLNNTFSAL